MAPGLGFGWLWDVRHPHHHVMEVERLVLQFLSPSSCTPPKRNFPLGPVFALLAPASGTLELPPVSSFLIRSPFRWPSDVPLRSQHFFLEHGSRILDSTTIVAPAFFVGPRDVSFEGSAISTTEVPLSFIRLFQVKLITLFPPPITINPKTMFFSLRLRRMFVVFPLTTLSVFLLNQQRRCSFQSVCLVCS